jgi:hypothetical protein
MALPIYLCRRCRSIAGAADLFALALPRKALSGLPL